MTRSLWRQLLKISGDQQISNQWRRKNKPQCVAPQKKYHANSRFIQPIIIPISYYWFCSQYSTFCMIVLSNVSCIRNTSTSLLAYFKVRVFNMTFIQYKPTFFHCQKFSQGFPEPSRKYFSPGTSHKISRVCYFINLHLDNEKQAPQTSLPPVSHKRQLLRKIVGQQHSTP